MGEKDISHWEWRLNNQLLQTLIKPSKPTPPLDQYNFLLTSPLHVQLTLITIHLIQYPYFIIRSKSWDHSLDVCAPVYDPLRHLLSGGYFAKVFSIFCIDDPYYALSWVFPPVLRIQAAHNVSAHFRICLVHYLYHSFLALFGPRLYPRPSKRHYYPFVGIKSISWIQVRRNWWSRKSWVISMRMGRPWGQVKGSWHSSNCLRW